MVGVSHLICHCLAQYVIFREIFYRLPSLIYTNHRSVYKRSETAQYNATCFPKVLLFWNTICVISRQCLYARAGYLDVICTESRNKIENIRAFTKHYKPSVSQLTGMIRDSDSPAKILIANTIEM